MNTDLLISRLEQLNAEKQKNIIWAAVALADLPEDEAKPILNIIEHAQCAHMGEQFAKKGKDS